MSLNKRLMSSQPAPFVASENFKAVIYTGNGGTQAITGVGFQPDLIWIKERSGADAPRLLDSTRGVNSRLFPSENNAASVISGTLNSFDTDGFTLGSAPEVNQNGETYVAWCWKANGGTTSSNTDGSITSTVQANTDAGFSIVKWTTNGSSSQTVGHGLGVTPEIIFFKRLDGSQDWFVETNVIDGGYDYGNLNTTAAFQDGGAAWSTRATSTTITAFTSSNNFDYIAYCFKSTDSFSKFGSYEGNGTTTGAIVETGFEPAFIIIKDVDGTDNWAMVDNKRATTNPRQTWLRANLDNAEFSNTVDSINFYSNGFQVAGGTSVSNFLNEDGNTFIFMAFAADPDTEAPTLASSFGIQTRSGDNSTTRTISGYGFQPSLVWVKWRTGNYNHAHILYTNLLNNPSANSGLSSSSNAALNSYKLTQFTDDGFQFASPINAVNETNFTFVGWAWKADDNEPTIFGGAAKAVYKFEDNANDVTGTYNGTASNVTYSSSGKFNKAAEFNGSSSKITSTAGLSGNPVFSISFWIYPTDYNGTPIMFGNNSSGQAFLTFINSSYKLNFGRWGDSLGDSTASVPQNTWTHIVIVNNSGSVQLYINGVADLSFSTTYSIANTNFYIGAANSTQYFDGKIDQVRIYNGVVSDIGVAELYAETVSDNDDLEFGGPPEILVSANSNAGFSIVKYNGTGAVNKIPHGLSAAPDMIIAKRLNSAQNWAVFHTSIGATKYLELNDSRAEDTATTVWNDTAPTATTVTLGTSSLGNGSGDNYIMYCFHDISNYQKFGSYTGTGSAGHAITVGFKPDFVLLKSSTSAENWSMFDSRRGEDVRVYANTNGADESNTSFAFSSTGFVLPQFGSMNGNGETFIYWAIAKNVPSNTTLANSFKAVTYTGTGGSRSVTGVGFKPDLIWMKRRNTAQEHALVNAVSGTLKHLYSDLTNAEQTTTNGVSSFDSDGFTVGANGLMNNTNDTYVAWAWKAGNTWQSNIDGSSPSTVNVNTANGFSIVKYIGNQTAGHTIGHGLGAVPEVIILKCLDSTNPWYVYHVGVDASNPAHYNLRLNESDARQDSTTEFNDTAPTSTVFTLGTTTGTNKTDNEYIAYCWTPKSGYSKFGSYSGTGSSNSITGLGFQPDWIMIKETDGVDSWEVYDSVRGDDKVLYPNGSNAEGTGSNFTSFDSDGFTVSSATSINENGKTYIYMAFKIN